MADVIRPNFSFEGCEITNRSPSYLIDEFIEWVTTVLLKIHNKKADDDISTQEHIDRGRVVSVHERSIINVMKELSISAGPWHLVDDRTNYPELDAHKEKQIGTLLESHNPFNIEYVEGIMQQEDDSLDCGLYIATFAEFLSDQLVIPPDTDGHLANYLCNRYATFLWRYDSDKVKDGYTSENDDPPNLKDTFVAL
ncbi:hypothetical protein EJD97_023298 [Solanum chilense]|uniref:Ubiquitin-like protease family profile domain-containing protein n=1 Tax=Solanum chilense TaxID=4083 RepID=A0A6N2ASA0_SOLCI|nr:hypothetical protein EJD97_023298 [Solanum chilense]